MLCVCHVCVPRPTQPTQGPSAGQARALCEATVAATAVTDAGPVIDVDCLGAMWATAGLL